MMEFSEVLHLDCDCISPEHILRFSYEKEPECQIEDQWITVDVILVNSRGFWQRAWYGVKYAFGYKSRFGPFDEFVMNKHNAMALKGFIEEVYSNTKTPE